MGPPAAAVLVAVVLALAACSPAASSGSIQPRDGRAGLQVTGQLGGNQVAVSDGSPRLDVGDCDPMDSADADVCAIGRDISGQVFVLSLENPAALRAGSDLRVDDPACRPAACDEVRDVAIVDVQSGTGRRIRARGGRLELQQVEPFRRYVGTAQLVLPGGDLSVSFDLVPRPE